MHCILCIVAMYNFRLICAQVLPSSNSSAINPLLPFYITSSHIPLCLARDWSRNPDFDFMLLLVLLSCLRQSWPWWFFSALTIVVSLMIAVAFLSRLRNGKTRGIHAENKVLVWGLPPPFHRSFLRWRMGNKSQIQIRLRLWMWMEGAVDRVWVRCGG